MRLPEQTRSRRIELALVAACIVSVFVVVAPVLRTNYLGDDAFNSYIVGWTGYERLSLPQAYALLYDGTNVSAGRFYPLYPLLLLVLYTSVRSLFVVKLLQVGAIIINALTFYALAIRSGAGRGAALCALAVLPLCFSFREFHDAILQFSLHFPLTLEFFLLALLSAQRYLASGSRPALVWTAASWAAAALLYDGMYPLVVAFFALALVAGPRARRLSLVSVTAGVVVILGAATSVQRLTHAPTAATYSAHLAPIAFVTYAAQTAAAIPLNYYLANPGGFFPGILPLWHRADGMMLEASIEFVVALGAGFACARRFRGDHAAVGRIVALGASLWLLPGILIAVAARYQDEIRFGLGHTPVYIEAYGVALLGGLLLSKLFLHRRGALEPVAILLSFVYGTNVAANALTLTRYGGWDRPRRLLTAALHAGVLGDAAGGSTLYVDHSTPINDQFGVAWWDPRYFYYAQTAKRYDVRPIEREATDAIAPGSHDLRVQSPQNAGGNVIVSRLQPGTASGLASTIDTARVFDERAGQLGQGGAGKRFAARDFRLITTSPEGALFAFASACGHLPVDALPDDSPAPIALDWENGFSVEERDATSTWHWAGAVATLQLIAITARPLHTLLHMELLEGSSARAYAQVSAAGRVDSVPLGATPRALAVPLDLARERPVQMRFRTDAPRVDAPGDTRDLRLQVRDVYVSGNC